jgi:hypothetical protein
VDLKGLQLLDCIAYIPLPGSCKKRCTLDSVGLMGLQLRDCIAGCGSGFQPERSSL